MIVKFIITKNGRIIFGTRPANEEFHADIAKNNDILLNEVAGGGRADLEKKSIFGSSTAFGKYDYKTVKKALPEWKVERTS